MSNLISIWQFIVGATYVVAAIYVIAIIAVIYFFIKYVIARFTVEKYIIKNINLRRTVRYFSTTGIEGLFYNKSSFENYVMFCTACYVDSYIHADDEVCDNWAFKTTDTFKCVSRILSRNRYDRLFNEIWKSFIREFDDSDIYKLTSKINDYVKVENKPIKKQKDTDIIDNYEDIPVDILQALTEDDSVDMVYKSHKKETPKGVSVLNAINDTYR